MAAKRSDSLLACEIFRLVGILDDRQVEIDQLIQRSNGCDQLIRALRPTNANRLHQARSQSREGHVRIELIEADLDVPPTDSPTARDVVAVVAAGEQFSQPLHERPLQSFNLRRAARDDLPRFGMPLDLGVEIVDERQQLRFHSPASVLTRARRRRSIRHNAATLRSVGRAVPSRCLDVPPSRNHCVACSREICESPQSSRFDSHFQMEGYRLECVVTGASTPGHPIRYPQD